LAVETEVLEVLVTEDQDLALRSVQSELVQTLLGELRELDTPDFGSKVRADMADFGVLVKEVGLGRVSSRTSIGVLYGKVSVNSKWRMT
jgi:hypothetical protein